MVKMAYSRQLLWLQRKKQLAEKIATRNRHEQTQKSLAASRRRRQQQPQQQCQRSSPSMLYSASDDGKAVVAVAGVQRTADTLNKKAKRSVSKRDDKMSSSSDMTAATAKTPPSSSRATSLPPPPPLESINESAEECGFGGESPTGNKENNAEATAAPTLASASGHYRTKGGDYGPFNSSRSEPPAYTASMLDELLSADDEWRAMTEEEESLAQEEESLKKEIEEEESVSIDDELLQRRRASSSSSLHLDDAEQELLALETTTAEESLPPLLLLSSSSRRRNGAKQQQQPSWRELVAKWRTTSVEAPRLPTPTTAPLLNANAHRGADGLSPSHAAIGIALKEKQPPAEPSKATGRREATTPAPTPILEAAMPNEAETMATHVHSTTPTAVIVTTDKQEEETISSTLSSPTKQLHYKKPGELAQLRAKLLSPSRMKQRVADERELLERQQKAEELRLHLQEEKAHRLQALHVRVEEVRRKRAELTERKRLHRERLNAERMRKAEENRTRTISAVVKRAKEDELRVAEITFINELDAENVRHEKSESWARESDRHQTRIDTLARERAQRNERKAAKEAAAEERRRQAEEQRLERLRENSNRKRERLELAEAQRNEQVERCRNKVLQRERQLAQRRSAERGRLLSAIRRKHEASERRHEDALESVRQRAAEATSVKQYSAVGGGSPTISADESAAWLEALVDFSQPPSDHHFGCEFSQPSFDPEEVVEHMYAASADDDVVEQPLGIKCALCYGEADNSSAELLLQSELQLIAHLCSDVHLANSNHAIVDVDYEYLRRQLEIHIVDATNARAFLVSPEDGEATSFGTNDDDQDESASRDRANALLTPPPTLDSINDADAAALPSIDQCERRKRSPHQGTPSTTLSNSTLTTPPTIAADGSAAKLSNTATTTSSTAAAALKKRKAKLRQKFARHPEFAERVVRQLGTSLKDDHISASFDYQKLEKRLRELCALLSSATKEAASARSSSATTTVLERGIAELLKNHFPNGANAGGGGSAQTLARIYCRSGLIDALVGYLIAVTECSSAVDDVATRNHVDLPQSRIFLKSMRLIVEIIKADTLSALVLFFSRGTPAQFCDLFHHKANKAFTTTAARQQQRQYAHQALLILNAIHLLLTSAHNRREDDGDGIRRAIGERRQTLLLYLSGGCGGGDGTPPPSLLADFIRRFMAAALNIVDVSCSDGDTSAPIINDASTNEEFERWTKIELAVTVMVKETEELNAFEVLTAALTDFLHTFGGNEETTTSITNTNNKNESSRHRMSLLAASLLYPLIISLYSHFLHNQPIDNRRQRFRHHHRHERRHPSGGEASSASPAKERRQREEAIAPKIAAVVGSPQPSYIDRETLMNTSQSSNHSAFTATTTTTTSNSSITVVHHESTKRGIGATNAKRKASHICAHSAAFSYTNEALERLCECLVEAWNRVCEAELPSPSHSDANNNASANSMGIIEHLFQVEPNQAVAIRLLHLFSHIISFFVRLQSETTPTSAPNKCDQMQLRRRHLLNATLRGVGYFAALRGPLGERTRTLCALGCWKRSLLAQLCCCGDGGLSSNAAVDNCGGGNGNNAATVGRASLPSAYFYDAALRSHLMPTLVTLLYTNARGLDVIREELCLQWLIGYVREAIAITSSSATTNLLQDGKNDQKFIAFARMISRERWPHVVDYFVEAAAPASSSHTTTSKEDSV